MPREVILYDDCHTESRRKCRIGVVVFIFVLIAAAVFVGFAKAVGAI
jgi:hypothetical protein